MEPKYLKYKTISLSNQLDPILVHSYLNQRDSVGFAILQELSTILQWVYPIQILLCFGGLNVGFEMWFILGYFLYLKPHLYGDTESALELLNMVKLAEVIPSEALPNIDLDHSHVNFLEKVLTKNKAFSFYTFQLAAIYLVSIFISLCIRRYILMKRNYKKYGVYINFITHYKEYIVTNFFAMYPFMALFLAIQFESLCKTSWNMDDSNVFINLMITTTVLMLVILLPFLVFSLFPPHAESV